jgi:transaldolase
VKYVEALIGPDTVNTMPRETIAAMLDHGELRRTLDDDFGAAAAAIVAVEALGISMATVTRELIEEGVAAFGKSFDELLGTIEEKRKALATA